MKFGVREICDVVFKAKSDVKIGNKTFKKGQPVLYIDTAKTSTVEGAATTVYATGGKGNTRLIAWEGEKTLTFTVEDALLSPIGFAVLSGAGLLQGKKEEIVHVHATSTAYTSEGTIDLTDALNQGEVICPTAPVFAVVAEEDGSITGELIDGLEVSSDGKQLVGNIEAGKTVFVDFYIQKASDAVSELQIDAENFAGYYYVEASTLFRRQSDGVDMPAELTLPNVKIQSNFTFSMASTGDPSTFTFTMDAFPGYTYFNPTRKVLCAIQMVQDTVAGAKNIETVFPHTDNEVINESKYSGEEGSRVPGDSIDEDYPLPRISENILTMPDQDRTILGKKVSEMIGKDTYVCTNGTIHGELKHIDNFILFSSNPSEQEGYYFPFLLSGTGEKMTFVKNGVVTKRDIDYDPEVLFRVTSPNTIWEVIVDNKPVVKLNFKTAMLV